MTEMTSLTSLCCTLPASRELVSDCVRVGKKELGEKGRKREGQRWGGGGRMVASLF